MEHIDIKEKKPDWLKVRLPSSPGFFQLKKETGHLGLATVCKEAKCPNIAECWEQKTLTIMIMGDTCTRFCKFCNVKTGNPKRVLDPEEPYKTAHLLSQLDLKYVVVTSVDRDDLEDSGAEHFAKTILAIKQECPNTLLETLIGDLKGELDPLKVIVKAKPTVISHNLETVKRLTGEIRDRRASYDRSLELLGRIKTLDPTIYTKSSLMVGMGETEEEVLETMSELRAKDVDFITIGQYLRPTEKHYPVKEYIHPDQFKKYEEQAREAGFKVVAASPLVRSSYKAGEYFIAQHIKKNMQ